MPLFNDVCLEEIHTNPRYSVLGSTYANNYATGVGVLILDALHEITSTDFFFFSNNMKNKKYHTVRTVPKSNRKIREKGKNDIPNTNASPLTFLA